MRRWFQGLALLASCGHAGCALLSKSEPLDLRYFEPIAAAGSAAEPVRGAASADGAENGQRLRLGVIKAARHLDLRIVSRRGAHELDYYDKLRWTERPEEFVRRALVRDLYEQAGFTRVVSGPGPTLEVELIAFEECERAGRRRGRIELQTMLHDERVQLDQETILIETDLDAAGRDRAEALVHALAEALRQASRRITERARVVLAERLAAR